MNNKVEIVVVIAFLVLVSAIWMESDVYRYVAFPTMIVSLYLYNRTTEKPKLPLMGKFCFLWAVFVIGYYVYVKITHPETMGGSAEGIYLLPLICPSIGYFFYLNRNVFSKFVWGFQIISFCTLLVSIEPINALKSPLKTKVGFLFHANTIHASLGAAFILIASIFFLAWVFNRKTDRIREFGIVLALVNITMSAIGIYGATSKGIWLSLGCLAVIALMYTVTFSLDKNVKLAVHGIFWSLTLMAAYILWTDNDRYLLNNFFGGIKVLNEINSIDSLSLNSLSELIDQANLPDNMAIRLHLWLKAIDIWSTNPIFGRGIYWENLWELQNQKFNYNKLVHNGYLSIAMRFGLVGLIFYGTLFFWSAKQIKDCADKGLVSKLVYYFSVTMLLLYLFSIVTNSNHRLAIGESFTVVFLSFGFMCSYLLQRTINLNQTLQQQIR